MDAGLEGADIDLRLGGFGYLFWLFVSHCLYIIQSILAVYNALLIHSDI